MEGHFASFDVWLEPTSRNALHVPYILAITLAMMS